MTEYAEDQDVNEYFEDLDCSECNRGGFAYLAGYCRTCNKLMCGACEDEHASLGHIVPI